MLAGISTARISWFYVRALRKAEKFLKLFPDAEHLCALLWFMEGELKIQRCSPSTALVIAIFAFSILSRPVNNSRQVWHAGCTTHYRVS